MDLINLMNSMEPWMIPIVVMICLTLMVAITTVGGIIKAKIKQNSGTDLNGNKEFLNALREFKENMERRVSNLETIASDAGLPSDYGGSRKQAEEKKAIDMDFEEQEEDENSSRPGKLQNMLNR